MLYEMYRDNRVYSGQQKITFPRKNEETGRIGEGAEILLMCPSRDKALECMSDPKLAFQQSMIKRFVTDSIFKEKIGTKRILRLERGKTDSFYLSMHTLPLKYIPYAARQSVISKKKSVVNDISRWMELTFARMDNLSARKRCSEFIRILRGRVNDPMFEGYEKILVFDLNSWNQNVRSCVVMNRKLLNNPLSILLYSACYFPEYLENFPDARIMILNRAFGQIYFFRTSFLTRKNYPKIKAKLSKFKDLIFSAEDEEAPVEDSEENVDVEVQSEIINSLKEDMKAKLRHNLLGPANDDDVFAKVDDITGEVADPFDELDREMAQANAEIIDREKSRQRKAEIEEDNEPLAPEPESSENEAEDNAPDDQIGDLNLTDEISEAVDREFANVTDIDSVDPDRVVKRLSEQIRDTKYKATFMPVKTEQEAARIERLTQGQKTVLDLPSIEDTKRKALTTRTTGGYIRTSNPAIVSSKFADFDKEYAEKCLNKNIDSAVAGLSNASEKIFVTGKTVEDSSDAMNLKELYTYHLEDEKGNKMTVAFDVPKIIDGSYVYLNGSKKIIKHQLILKPIVKTGTDVVQLVTSYNKVFIYRQGVENQNVNRLRVFISKNADRLGAREGNCSMLNAEYEIPLDMAMLSRYYLSFRAGSYTFYLSVNSLKEAYRKAKGKDLQYDTSRQIPIALNTRTKEPLFLDLDGSFTDTVLEQLSEEDRKAIAAIKRKPRSVMACAKMMKRFIPLVIFMMYCEGFASVMHKANIRYEIIEKKDRKKYDPMRWDFIELSDGLIVWEKVPFRNELIMNGFRRCDMTDFSIEELESKDTYISLVSGFYPGNSRIHYAFDNYRDFLLDDKTKEILTDFGYPTDLVSLLVVAAGMLTDTKFMIENNLNNMRVRNTEVIADLVYIVLTNAYNKYRTTAYKKKPTKVSVKRSIIIDKLLDSDTNMVEEVSFLNPVLEIEKQRGVTFKGLRGIQMSRAMTLPRRSYDRSMVGTIAMNTATDANVGVTRSLTLEPAITSTYGYIDAAKSKDLDSLKSANLLSVTELLQPMGSLHDDPDRTSIDLILVDVKPRKLLETLRMETISSQAY